MESETALPFTQGLANCLYLELISSVHELPIYFFRIYLNIFLPSTSSPSKWSLSFMCLHQSPVYIFPLPIRAAYLANLIFLVDDHE